MQKKKLIFKMKDREASSDVPESHSTGKDEMPEDALKLAHDELMESMDAADPKLLGKFFAERLGNPNIHGATEAKAHIDATAKTLEAINFIRKEWADFADITKRKAAFDKGADYSKEPQATPAAPAAPAAPAPGEQGEKSEGEGEGEGEGLGGSHLSTVANTCWHLLSDGPGNLLWLLARSCHFVSCRYSLPSESL